MHARAVSANANALTWCFWMVQGAAPELDLPLPEVDAEHVIVQCDNEICHGNPESRTQTEELWRSLEAPLLAGEGLRWTSAGNELIVICKCMKYCWLSAPSKHQQPTWG